MPKDVAYTRDFIQIYTDFKDAYLSVPIHESCRKFLRFLWKGTFYQFKALPFGLCSAPRIFTKVLKPVAAFLRKKAIQVLTYLDDFLLLAATAEEAVKKYSAGSDSPSVPRFYNKPQEIITDSNTSDNLPGFPNRLNVHDYITPSRKKAIKF